MSGGDFLARWSRRKRDVAEHEATRPVSTNSTSSDEAVADASGTEPADAVEAGEGVALTPEEIARLPALDDLRVDTDLIQFLRKGVPRLLRNAALRRMWTLDPGIRDYVSEARDYAYDWNMVGGVPGYGPLLPSDDVGAMLKQIVGGLPEARDAAEAPRDRGIADATTASATAEAALHEQIEAATLEAPEDAKHIAPAATQGDAPLIPTNDGLSRNKIEAVSPVRRHGSAIPI
ncbi:DUF3306 domain-containing protein [Methylobacterium soli]|uniref:DUF3306 domain-containing protein n=1 Tax=Methylobacterium soli TaxID=553447 RepID=A0A6L3T6I5_9HYPH|nr:DUF3306 domain-containing protein [Methylobacterium soli]KAB1080991.1 DUF3306 domain-containing protein [Methylobacterium soli]GJE46081.1 hypothetical protein AEGHOMDF_5281 [Methylobacterium soli]